MTCSDELNDCFWCDCADLEVWAKASRFYEGQGREVEKGLNKNAEMSCTRAPHECKSISDLMTHENVELWRSRLWTRVTIVVTTYDFRIANVSTILLEQNFTTFKEF